MILARLVIICSELKAVTLCRYGWLFAVLFFVGCTGGKTASPQGVTSSGSDSPSSANDAGGGAGIKEGLLPNDEAQESRSNFGPGRFNSRFRKSRGFVQVSKVIDSRSPRLTNVWISANMVKAMHSGRPEIPDGTVAIKEFDTVEGKRLGVMVKMGKGYDPAGHDWYYEVRDQSGELLQDPPSGKIAACKSCHERQQGNGGLKSMSLSH